MSRPRGAGRGRRGWPREAPAPCRGARCCSQPGFCSFRPISPDGLASPPAAAENPFLCCRSSSAAFREALREIEQRPACGGLPMISFLILPMQRVTRLPLLTDVSAQGGGPGSICRQRALLPPDLLPPLCLLCMVVRTITGRL